MILQRHCMRCQRSDIIVTVIFAYVCLTLYLSEYFTPITAETFDKRVDRIHSTSSGYKHQQRHTLQDRVLTRGHKIFHTWSWLIDQRGGNDTSTDSHDFKATNCMILNQNETVAMSNSDSHNVTTNGFTILSETLIYENWRRLISRRVQLPSGHVANFEIVGQKLSTHSNDTDDAMISVDEAVLIFVWNRKTKTTTLIREYMPSVHRIMYGLAAGMVEIEKHTTYPNDANSTDDDTTALPVGINSTMSLQEIAARHELEEECQLRDGTWIRLNTKPVVMDKYSMTGLTVFLVLDPISIFTTNDESIRLQRDATEEGMEIITDITLEQLYLLIYNSELAAIGSWASLLALHHLQTMGEINF